MEPFATSDGRQALFSLQSLAQLGSNRRETRVVVPLGSGPMQKIARSGWRWLTELERNHCLEHGDTFQTVVSVVPPRGEISDYYLAERSPVGRRGRPARGSSSGSSLRGLYPLPLAQGPLIRSVPHIKAHSGLKVSEITVPGHALVELAEASLPVERRRHANGAVMASLLSAWRPRWAVPVPTEHKARLRRLLEPDSR